VENTGKDKQAEWLLRLRRADQGNEQKGDETLNFDHENVCLWTTNSLLTVPPVNTYTGQRPMSFKAELRIVNPGSGV
jgi:hypothetical protein